MKRKPFFLSALYLAMGVVLLAACAASPICPPLEPGEVELEFETLEWSGFSSTGGIVQQEENIVVLSQAEELSLPDGWPARRIQQTVDEFNFDSHFLILLSHGFASSTGPSANIKRVTQHQGILRVCAEFWDGSGGAGLTVNYPYHFVKVTRNPDLEISDTAVLQPLTVKGVFPDAPKPE